MSEYTVNQQKAIASIHGNTAVVAGAGSGKTSVLVERYLRLLKEGIDCRQILAITFTNKAAGEMAERIRSELTVQARLATAAQRQFWLEQKALLASAYIGTIHGLCANILRAHPVQAGVAPDFAILDETQALLLSEEAVKSALQKLIKQRDQDTLRLCQEYTYGRLFYHVQNLLPHFTLVKVQESNFLEELSRGHQQALAEFAKAKRALLASLDELLAGIDKHKPTAHRAQLELIKEHLAEVRDAANCLAEDRDKVTVLDKYLDPLTARSSDKELVNLVKEQKKKLVAWSNDNRAMELLPAWAKVLKACVESYHGAKKRRGVLSFDDLEHLTCRLLLDNPQLCEKYAQKYSHLMIDEFQDTNQLQQTLAYLLAGQDSRQLQNKKLFVVGDDKQSIYRFRGADVSIFGKVRQDILASGGQELQLLENFRSDAQILAVCNDLFDQVMAGKGITYLPLQAGKAQTPRQAPPVEAIFLSEEEISEPEAVAARLQALAAQGQFKYAEMAVLLRAKTHLEEYIQAFEQLHIPYNILDGQGYFEVPEVVDMLNLLRFLDNPLRDLPLLGILRSPLLGLDDETITQLFLSAGEESLWHKLSAYSPGQLQPEQAGLVARAQQLLPTLLQKAQIYPLGILVRQAIDSLRIMPLLMAYPDAKQRYANLEKLVDLVFAFEYEKNAGLTEFLNHVDNLLAKEARESLEQIETEQSDAVKVLTIHKAKGLQFKVVVVAECDAAFYTEKEAVFYDRKKGLGIKVRGPGGKLEQTGYFSSLRERDAAENTEEMKRLLYVAMTRAEEQLILTGKKGKISERQSWLNWFLQVFTEEQEYFCGSTSKIKKVALDELLAGQTAVTTQKKQLHKLEVTELLPQVQPLTIKEEQAFCFSATALRDYRHCQRMFYYKYLEQMPEFAAAELLGTGGSNEPPAHLTGLIAHEVLQNSSQENFEQVFARACQQHLGQAAGPQADAIKPWLQAYLQSELHAQIKSHKHLSEYAFKLPLFPASEAEYIFTGSIDCLVFDGEDKLKVIDFKSDRAVEGRLDEYGLQLYLYALAAQKLFPDRQVVSAQLHFLRLQESRDFDLAQDRSEEILALCSEIATKQQEREFACNQEWCKYCTYSYFCLQGQK